VTLTDTSRSCNIRQAKRQTIS